MGEQWQGVLAGGAQAVAHLGDGHPIGVLDQQLGQAAGGGVDRSGAEVDPLPLDHQGPPDQLGQLGPVDPRRLRRGER